MHEFHGMGRGQGRFNSYLGVVNFKPRYHSFIGISRPQYADGVGGASAPNIPTPFVFHNDEDAQEANRKRQASIAQMNPTRSF